MYLRCNTQIVSFLSDSKYIKRVTRKWWSMEKKHWRRIVIAQEKQFHATWVCLGLNLLKCCLWLSCNWRWKQKRSTWNKTREFHILKLNVEMHHWAACHMLSYLFLSTQPPKFPHQTHDSQVCKTRHHKRFLKQQPTRWCHLNFTQTHFLHYRETHPCRWLLPRESFIFIILNS